MVACVQLAGLRHVITSRAFLDKAKVKTEGNVINLMDALRQSLKGQSAPAVKATAATREAPAKPAAKSKKRAEGQREMLFAIGGKGQKTAAKADKKADTKREAAKRPARSATRQKRTG